MAWAEDVNPGVVKLIGALEILAAIGLILPAALGIAPILAPLAALGLVRVMAGAIVTHARRRETRVIGVNVVLPMLAAVVVWGRFGRTPSAPDPFRRHIHPSGNTELEENIMRALHVPAAGEKPQIGDLPTPAVTDGSVLIRVKAAALNPVDNAIAAGYLAGMMPHAYPLVIGRDAAGVVQAVGAGVDHVKPGDEVFGHVLLAPPIQAGTLAEYAVLPAAAVAVKPADLDFVQAAALPLAGAAAAQAVDAIEAQPGHTVLVNGASGGVGSYAVQLLAARGVTVIATGSDTARLTSLGATTVVDRADGPIADQVLAAYPGGVDALVNLFGPTIADVPLAAVREGGKVSTLTPAPDTDAATSAGVTVSKIMARAVREITGPLAQQAAAGTLTIDVGSVITLDDALDGLATIAAGHANGKTIVTLDN